MKKLLISFAALLVALSMTLPAFAAQFTVNSVSALTPNHPVTIVYLAMLDSIQKRADAEFPGQLQINHRGGPEVIAQNEQAEALRTGMIDMSDVAASYYISAMPEMDTLALSEMDPAEERASSLFAYLDEIHRAKMGIAYLGRLGPGITFYLASTKPFSNLADLKSRRIRVSPTNIPLMRLLDIEPVQIPHGEIYTAVERGVVDGFVNPPADLPDLGLIPMAKYVLIPPFYRPTNPVLMNAAKWDSLPDGIKKIFTEEISKAEVVIMQQAADQEKGVLDQVRAAGGQFVELSPAETAQFTDMANKALLDTTLEKSPVESQKIFDLSRKPK